ncbi:MAG: M6 family metalloprotease domain-containing protein, partial [Candidatus Krumholzibacteria bacterium]|nr:M6 family metalloprotease domain-containing protein [Candidatus Krumholzibacteria bacterium]
VLTVKYANTGADPYPAANLQARLFNPAPALSVTSMYDEMSYGALTLTGTVYDWVTLSGNDNFYEGPPGCRGVCGSARTGQLILDVLQANDPAIDFGIYDNDGPDGVPNSGDDDGLVDFIAIVQPEIGAECGTLNMWSHRWVVGGWPEFGASGSTFGSPWTTNDPRTGGGSIQVWDYTIQPARGSVTGCGSGMIEIGVFAHEFGHAFGLPDLYDTDGGGEGIGEHGLMGSGNWQNPPNPTHMSVWSKAELGWLVPTEVGPTLQPHTINSVEVNAEVHQLNIMEEKFRRKGLDPIAGAFSLHCGLTPAEATARNWTGGAGYGNGWDEAVRRGFSYDGNDPVTLQYDVAYDTEPAYDFGYVKIKVGGVENTLASYDGTSSATGVVIDLTPYLTGSGESSYELIAQFTSDFAWSDEDGDFLSGVQGPFKLDNVSVTGGGESYSTDFEAYEDGWCYDFVANPNQEYFLLENRNKSGAMFDQHLHGEGLYIWHIEQNVARSTYGITGGTAGTTNLKPASVTLMEADGLRDLLLGVDRGDGGDMYPGSTSNTTFDDLTNPSSRNHNGLTTNVAVLNIGPPAAAMSADMRAGRFPPTVASIAPSTGDNDQVVPISALLGTWFYKGGTFCLRDATLTEYPATGVEWIGKAKAAGDLDLNGLAGGDYDVVWKGPDGQEAILVDGFTVNAVATGVGDTPLVLTNRLGQNYPNPFNPSTTIRYSLRQRGLVTLRIYNAAGQRVRTLVHRVQAPRAGGFAVVWDGSNDAGESVASGIYLYELLIGKDFRSVRKLVMIK